jgi:hypothetical protein
MQIMEELLVTWQGQLQNKDGNMNIGLEAFANQSLWI